jgi:transcriptional regulator with XRE-family HTH domain
MGGMNSIGSRVKLLREGRRLTQKALAKAIRISQPALSMIETGATESLSGEVLAGLCRELTTTPDFVLYGSGSLDDFESALQIAEVTSIMHKLPTQARETLLSEARLLARATLPAPSHADPFLLAAPEDRRHADRRTEPNPDRDMRRNELLNPSRGTGKDQRRTA